jgi:predicted MFS family arabinose efflux permease
MLAGCGLSAAALWPVLRLRLSPATAGRGRVYPRGRFIHRYLIAFGLWNLATGAFNPLYNVYFAKILRASTQTIGSLFSVAQMAQVVALLAAPAVLRKLGLTGGISAMMVATGVTLLGLAGAPGLATASAVYAAYMGFQWMSEPGIGTLLMNRVKADERGGASALNYLVAFLAQALAASAAGAIAQQMGFPTLLLGASALAVAAGLMFLALPADRAVAVPPSLRESASENAPM